MKFWCQLPEDGNNVETCTSSVIERIHRLSNCAFFGVTKVSNIEMHGKNNAQ